MKTQGQGGHTCAGGRVAPANAAKAPGLCAHRVRSGTPAVTLVPQDAVSRAPLNPAGRKGVAFLLDRVHPKSQTPHPDPEKMVTRPNRVPRKYRTDRRVKDPSAQVSPVAQSCPTLCDPMDCSMPGPVHHQLLELPQTHVHRVSDAIQPSHPVSSPSPPTFNLSQHQGLSQ